MTRLTAKQLHRHLELIIRVSLKMTSTSKVFYRSYFESHAEKSLHTMRTNTQILCYYRRPKLYNFRIPLEREDELRKALNRGSEWFWNIYLWYYRYRYYVWNGAKVQDIPERKGSCKIESKVNKKSGLYYSRENDKNWCDLQLDCHSLCYRWTIMAFQTRHCRQWTANESNAGLKNFCFLFSI